MDIFRDAVAKFSRASPIRVTAETLQAFLDETAALEADGATRLRWLAIEVENFIFEHGWNDLRYIYLSASRGAPNDSGIHISWGVSATRWAEPWITPAFPDRIALTEEAEQHLLLALEMAPRSGRIAHTLGYLYYKHPARETSPEAAVDQAIDWFRRAIEWEPAHAMARLYLAHCHGDQGDWARAASTYAEVDLETLARDWPAWRATKCREQLAYCHARLGQTAEAMRQFHQLLDDAETWDLETAQELIMNLDELVASVTNLLDDPPLRERTRTLVNRLEMGPRYPNL